MKFDILVIGGGHAGIEAVNIACQFENLSVGLITLPSVEIGSTPCNPSIGGVGKGQVVRELDSLGGLMGLIADKAGIQYRTLNESKGFAVRSTRVQVDKAIYAKVAESELEKISNLTIVKAKVLKTSKIDLFEVVTDSGSFYSDKLIFTVGTFLNGKLHLGEKKFKGGRMGALESDGLEDIFEKVATNSKRFKTGTPPRLDRESVDFSQLEEQKSDSSVNTFHVLHGTSERVLKQKSCYLTYTNSETMKVIRDNKEKSPMFNGDIKATGARYCPSIEDKGFRYPDKDIHHVFIEPEGLNLRTVYPSGISSSLPEDVQVKMVNSIVGLENAKILQPGYAVEYDVVDTTKLDRTLQHQEIPGLYFAGQVNGTSGYEEAGAQGFIAGVNAGLSVLGRESLILDRMDSYIGVMIEDLVSNLRDEPYRLFTARSENRLFIREDNATLRMLKYRNQLNLNSEIDYYLKNFEREYKEEILLLKNYFVSPGDEILIQLNLEVPRRTSFADVLRIANLDPIDTLINFYAATGISKDLRLIEAIAISLKYEGYIAKADNQSLKMRKLNEKIINWSELIESENISFECKQRIKQIKPETFGQLARIEGIRQATLSAVAGSYF